MSRKHFEALAAAIKESYNQAETAEARSAVACTAAAIARVCLNDNPRFDDKRFIVACGFGN